MSVCRCGHRRAQHSTDQGSDFYCLRDDCACGGWQEYDPDVHGPVPDQVAEVTPDLPEPSVAVSGPVAPAPLPPGVYLVPNMDTLYVPVSRILFEEMRDKWSEPVEFTFRPHQSNPLLAVLEMRTVSASRPLGSHADPPPPPEPLRPAEPTYLEGRS